MSTIRQDISNIRSLIKQVQDDTDYTDQFLYSLITVASAKLQEQHAMRNSNNFHWTTFCVPLVKAKSHNCDCVEVGCDVLKSKYKIPHAMDGKRGSLLFKVETLGDVLIPPRTPQEVITDNLDDIKSGRTSYFIRDSHLIIWNNLDLKAIQVSGMWEDISKWQGKELCDTDGNPLPACEDVMEMVIPLENNLRFDMYKMVLSLLRIPLSVQEDITSDANSEIKA